MKIWVRLVLIINSLVLIILVLFLAVFRFLFLIVSVYGSSMYPILEHGDRVLVLRHFPYNKLRKNLIVLISSVGFFPDLSTSQEGNFFIKRLIGLPGDSIYFSNMAFEKGFLHKTKNRQIDINKKWYIPFGSCFVCGDNLSVSIDSRNWGPIPLTSLKGIVVMRLPKKATKEKLRAFSKQKSITWMGSRNIEVNNGSLYN